LNRKYIILVTVTAGFLIFGCGALAADFIISSKISSRINREIPNASGIKTSVPLTDMPHNLTSDSIKSVDINIDSYSLRGTNADSSLAITATEISKSQPTLIGSLDLTITIPASTILKSADFQNAQIVGKAIEVSVGAGGLGKALLVPKFSKNQLYFQLQSVSIFGSEIPSSSLPSDIQNQIKSRSIRNLQVPKGLKAKSVSISNKGLLIKMYGSNVKLGNLGTAF
jgi:hypothetical protein